MAPSPRVASPCCLPVPPSSVASPPSGPSPHSPSLTREAHPDVGRVVTAIHTEAHLREGGLAGGGGGGEVTGLGADSKPELQHLNKDPGAAGSATMTRVGWFHSPCNLTPAPRSPLPAPLPSTPDPHLEDLGVLLVELDHGVHLLEPLRLQAGQTARLCAWA